LGSRTRCVLFALSPHFFLLPLRFGLPLPLQFLRRIALHEVARIRRSRPGSRAGTEHLDDPIHRRVHPGSIVPTAKQAAHPLQDQASRRIRQDACEPGPHLDADAPLVRGPYKQNAVVHTGLSHAPRMKEPPRIVVHQHPVQRRHDRDRDLVPRGALIRPYLRFQRLRGRSRKLVGEIIHERRGLRIIIRERSCRQ